MPSSFIALGIASMWPGLLTWRDKSDSILKDSQSSVISISVIDVAWIVVVAFVRFWQHRLIVTCVSVSLQLGDISSSRQRRHFRNLEEMSAVVSIFTSMTSEVGSERRHMSPYHRNNFLFLASFSFPPLELPYLQRLGGILCNFFFSFSFQILSS